MNVWVNECMHMQSNVMCTCHACVYVFVVCLTETSAIAVFREGYGGVDNQFSREMRR